MSENAEADLKIVQAAVNRLAEHFDAVQVFAQKRVDGTGTIQAMQFGAGNWYARWGHVHEWMIKNDEQAKIELRKENE